MAWQAHAHKPMRARVCAREYTCVRQCMGLAWQSHEVVPGAARLKLENLHTMTLFYLAQVYAK